MNRERKRSEWKLFKKIIGLLNNKCDKQKQKKEIKAKKEYLLVRFKRN